MTIAPVHPDTTQVVDAAFADRYNQDLALDRTMIPLGSCTMKLNATAEREAISWLESAGIHPFAPSGQTAGRRELIDAPEVVVGDFAVADSPLRRAPHTVPVVAATDWDRPCSREQAAYPVDSLRQDTYFPPTGRIDDAAGERTLICSCPASEPFEVVALPFYRRPR